MSDDVDYWKEKLFKALGDNKPATSDICERLNKAQIGPSNLDYSAISYVLSLM